MAENTTSTATPTTTPVSKPAAAKKPAARKRKPAAKKSAARKQAARRATRSTTATTPSKSTGRRNRTVARNETREAAKANIRAARTTAEQGKSLVERAALTYVGATLEARDRVVDAAGSVADTFSTRKKAVRELEKLQARYERRGTTSRNQLERDVKKAGTRLERVVRRNRNAVEKRRGASPDVDGAAHRRLDRVEGVALAGVSRHPEGRHDGQGPHDRDR